MKSIDSVKTHAHGMSKDLIWTKKKLKLLISYNNTKMFNFDYITKEDIKEHKVMANLKSTKL